jgi:TrpR family transcriptional regulator, trp operon repressor
MEGENAEAPEGAELKEIAELLADSGDSGFIEEFLRQLLTPSEIEEVEKRWTLVKLLHKGKSQREIAALLHISLCKITRGSRELKKEHNAFERALETIDRQGREAEGHGRE